MLLARCECKARRREQKAGEAMFTGGAFLLPPCPTPASRHPFGYAKGLSTTLPKDCWGIGFLPARTL